VLGAGAYGFVMASNYNSRPLPAEVLVDAGGFRVVRPRQELSELFETERCAAGAAPAS
jgi:diaminopimelate decarboxylase